MTHYIHRLEIALNPRRWTQAHHDAWHRYLPDTQQSFAAFLSLAMTPDPTPTPEVPDALLERWRLAAPDVFSFTHEHVAYMAQRTAAWAWSQREEEVREAEQRGADAAYDDACEQVEDAGYPMLADKMRSRRRPSPPTLRERALAVVEQAHQEGNYLDSSDVALIREALQEGADG